MWTLSNASASYTQFRSSLADLGEVDWPAVASYDFRSAEMKEGKQAEFLLHGSFPWSLVSRIGVHSRGIAQRAVAALGGAQHHPTIEVRQDWYY